MAFKLKIDVMGGCKGVGNVLPKYINAIMKIVILMNFDEKLLGDVKDFIKTM